MSASDDVRATAKYQAELAKEAERAGDYDKARWWSDKSTANQDVADAWDDAC